jgi:hypothetical protein
VQNNSQNRQTGGNQDQGTPFSPSSPCEMSFPFLDLPFEIRIIIYDHYFEDLRWESFYRDSKRMQRRFNRCLALYLVTKQIKQEATYRFYTIHLPRFKLVTSSVEDLARIAKIIPREHWSKITAWLEIWSSDKFCRDFVPLVLELLAKEAGFMDTRTLIQTGVQRTRSEWRDLLFTGTGWEVQFSWRVLSSESRYQGWLSLLIFEMKWQLGQLPFFENMVNGINNIKEGLRLCPSQELYDFKMIRSYLDPGGWMWKVHNA